VICAPFALRDAKDWFGAYHYTGTAAGYRFLATAEDGQVLCVIGIGRGANRCGVGDKFGLTAFVGDLEITRVACHPNAPRNTASRSIAMICRHLAGEGIEWLFSYADSGEGHHGGIYQAVNAAFVGSTARQWVNFEMDGKRVSKRKVSGRFGHTRWPEVEAIAADQGVILRKVEWHPKLTYILNIAKDARRRKLIAERLAGVSLPYPKPDTAKSTITPYRNHRGRA
jgi:hypothetical protein